MLGNDLERLICNSQYSRGKCDCMENEFIQDNVRDHDEGEETEQCHSYQHCAPGAGLEGKQAIDKRCGQ